MHCASEIGCGNITNLHVCKSKEVLFFLTNGTCPAFSLAFSNIATNERVTA